jgi:hypothetical protein
LNNSLLFYEFTNTNSKFGGEDIFQIQ